MHEKPALDPMTVEARTTTIYPEPYDQVTAGRAKRSLSAALGLTQFGVNLTELAPGAATGLRHWHTREDEFVYVLGGEVVLVTSDGEQRLVAGMCVGYPAGRADGHCLVNRSDQSALLLEVGTRDAEDEVYYPDHDLVCRAGRYAGARFTRKDGSDLDQG